MINLVTTPDKYRVFVSAMLLFTFYLACYSIYLYFTGSALKQQDFQRSQATGIFGDPNDLAATIVGYLAFRRCSRKLSSGRGHSPLVARQ